MGPGDRPLVAAWMAAPHCAPWWDVADLDDPAWAHLRRRVAFDGDDAVGFVETYAVADDPLGACDCAQPGDAGFHVLIGPPERLGTGVAQTLVREVIGELLEGAPRVVCEPDVRNERMLAFCRGLGGEDLGEVDIAGKRGQVFAWTAVP